MTNSKIRTTAGTTAGHHRGTLSLIALPILLAAVAAVTTMPRPACAAQATNQPEAKPITVIPVTDNLDARKAAFDARNTPATVEALGKDFLARTYIPTWDAREFRKPGGWETLTRVRAHIDAKEHGQALDLFKTYTLEKFRSVETSGLPRGRFDPFSTGVVGVQWIRPLLVPTQKDETIKQAKQLMTGMLTTGDRKMKIGEPGTVNWAAISALSSRTSNSTWPWDPEAFYPLLGAYIYTGDKAYMDKWAAYVDDWAMNQTAGPRDTNIADIPDQWANGVETMLTLLRYFGGVANMPGGEASVPAPTFARVMSRMVDDFVPVSILYHRSNPQNWNEASLTALPDVGYFLEEYPIGRQLLQESRRRLDLLISTHHLPDATEMDTTVGYSNLYIVGPGTFLSRVARRQKSVPEWMLTKWEKEEWRDDPRLGYWERTVRNEMLRRARTLTGHIQADGEYPIGGTRNRRQNESHGLYANLHYFLPDAFRNPDISNVLALTTGRRPDGKPSYKSDRTPYGGHTYIRHGWDPKDPYLYMYAAPQPLSGSLSVRNNNAIGLSGWGYDLIETGENGVYDQPHTPVKVDGLDQHFPFGVLAWGHRGPMLTTSVYTTPNDWRWHTSLHFDVAEGIYKGNYGREKKLDDVTHQRMVQYVRGAGFWIVTDRLKSPRSHNYTLNWRFGVKPGHEKDFTADQITVQPEQSSIRTSRADGPNVSLYQYASTPLAVTKAEERTPSEQYRLHDFVRVSSDWKAQGECTVVTAIYPRNTGGAELNSIKSLDAAGAKGFEAVTPTGARIQYQAATVAPAALKVGELGGSAESLLLTTEADGTRRGVALGCKSLTLAGKAVAIPAGDFEFQISGGKLTTTTIHRPLLPVTISPSDATAFIGKQVVTLASASPNVEIRYTLDGSEPTHVSPLYTAPLTLTETATVTARSMRPGTTVMPTNLSGTLVSDVTTALYDAVTPMKAVNAANTVPGLKYDYYEARWQQLLSATNRLKPIKSGQVPGVFDISNKGTAPTYAFRYAGFLEAPADGVYIFTAPPEYYEPNTMAAYELRLILDGKEWYPATSRHGLGTWSVALSKGKHALEIYYADMRADGIAKMNKPNLKPIVWEGATPKLQLSGPGLKKGPIPSYLLSHTP